MSQCPSAHLSLDVPRARLAQPGGDLGGDTVVGLEDQLDLQEEYDLEEARSPT